MKEHIPTLVRVAVYLLSGVLAKHGIEQVQAESWGMGIAEAVAALVTIVLAIVTALKHNKKLLETEPPEPQ